MTDNPQKPPPSPFSAFREMLKKDGVAKSYLMDVEIQPCSLMKDVSTQEVKDNLKFKCEDAELPGKTFETSNVKDYVIDRKHVLGVTYADLNLTFICSSDMRERRYFDEWMEYILGTNTKRVTYYDKYVSPSIKINLYQGPVLSDLKMTKACTYTIKNAYPVAITAQDLAWNKEDNLKLTVNFNYECWEVEYYK